MISTKSFINLIPSSWFQDKNLIKLINNNILNIKLNSLIKMRDNLINKLNLDHSIINILNIMIRINISNVDNNLIWYIKFNTVFNQIKYLDSIQSLKMLLLSIEIKLNLIYQENKKLFMSFDISTNKKAVFENYERITKVLEFAIKIEKHIDSCDVACLSNLTLI